MGHRPRAAVALSRASPLAGEAGDVAACRLAEAATGEGYGTSVARPTFGITLLPDLSFSRPRLFV